VVKNVIFDMGNVLIHWDPQRLIARQGVEGEDAKRLLREVFCDQEWAGLDRGRLTEEEAIASVCARLPEHLHPVVPKLVYWWHDPLWPIEGMRGLIAEIRALGYHIYLCSNATSALHVYFPRIPGSEHFDGILVSADHRLLKPDHEIYELLYSSFSLNPAECFFIDDAPYNIDGGIMSGMSGAVFDGDLKRLRRDLRKAGIMVYE
jgi:haloacid dehalogenase superfamily, subfamily IA, variant 3 with third motif having DD or ED